jgi:hypothetical protein
MLARECRKGRASKQQRLVNAELSDDDASSEDSDGDVEVISESERQKHLVAFTALFRAADEG